MGMAESRVCAVFWLETFGYGVYSLMAKFLIRAKGMVLWFFGIG